MMAVMLITVFYSRNHLLRFTQPMSANINISQLPKHERKRIIMGGGASSKIAAAVEIQRIWRGHRIRRRLCVSPMKFKYTSVEPSLLSVMSGYSGTSSSSSRSYCSRIKKCYRQHLEQCCTSGSDLLPQPTFQDYCAKRIQQWWKHSKEKVDHQNTCFDSHCAYTATC